MLVRRTAAARCLGDGDHQSDAAGCRARPRAPRGRRRRARRFALSRTSNASGACGIDAPIALIRSAVAQLGLTGRGRRLHQLQHRSRDRRAALRRRGARSDRVHGVMLMVELGRPSRRHHALRPRRDRDRTLSRVLEHRGSRSSARTSPVATASSPYDRNMGELSYLDGLDRSAVRHRRSACLRR